MSLYERVKRQRDAFVATFKRGYWRTSAGTLSDQALDTLAILRPFCRADSSCIQFGKDGRFDTHLTAAIEGRREVWLEICRVINLGDADLLQLQRHEETHATRNDDDNG